MLSRKQNYHQMSSQHRHLSFEICSYFTHFRAYFGRYSSLMRKLYFHFLNFALIGNHSLILHFQEQVIKISIWCFCCRNLWWFESSIYFENLEFPVTNLKKWTTQFILKMLLHWNYSFGLVQNLKLLGQYPG